MAKSPCRRKSAKRSASKSNAASAVPGRSCVPRQTRNLAIDAEEKSGCLENFLHRGHCHRFEMHPIPQVRHAPGEPVDSELPPSLIKIAGPELAIWFLTGEPMKDADHDRVCHGDDGPLLPTACGETLIQRRERGVLGMHGRMRQL